MFNYLAQRLAGAVLVVFGVISIVFLLIHLIPGDPVEIMLGESASAADRESLRIALGLDQPVLLQFTHYLNGLLQFDLGTSLQSHRPVTDLLLERLPATLLLAGVTLVVTLALALPLGVIAAVRCGSSWDGGAMAFSMLGVSIAVARVVPGERARRRRFSCPAGCHPWHRTRGGAFADGAQQHAGGAGRGLYSHGPGQGVAAVPGDTASRST